MPGSSSAPDSEAGVATRRGIRWDALAAIIASLVGLLALCVAGYTAYIQRQQVRAQVWPYLQISHSNAEGRYDLEVVNRGVGPALIQSVTVSAGSKPVADWKAFAHAIGFVPTSHYVTSTLNQMVVSPGEHVRWIAFQNAKDINTAVADSARFHVEVRVCYTSTLGDAWLTAFSPGRRGGFRPRPVAECPKVPEAEQFQD